ncbi:Cys-tRNA(Pro)/Cys-tRNA(Cys) deacylase YbaK [Leuconostoc suionicum]|uniref:Cys-tRNA(Pro)/Cys-tRNA(Cys) deacylase n=2 Tax=Lactobacillaceae TaxID=33958 RepID=A0A2N9KGE2_9LACO|nr:aminoacyl-tRNA deacylase [Leuconostoc suionicum]MDV7704204.1 aminoacyl-tRNA deacylase [Leuconostoc suionicum]SPD93705.1 Cys-tRNA(Pro)/Cys-tRNA(Cys) deacylase YbaK [Leuconostoc suionicum]SPE09361.1 Cys-tRNA(Pro)/Cys-tRNA(Cys) deacylase YbaK [Leuconostoc suionicum]SPH04628.1 Cys-tRNA(Pro)/Cys-tRNA(Cys) deacylase YbaK [Leuconostoc suionicum]
MKKTLPEQVMDKHNVNYEPLNLNILDKTPDERDAILETFHVKHDDIYKTLAAHGDKTGPIVAVLPITKHLSLKKLAAVSGNKKVAMLPLKDLQKTTGYIHGANNPVGIWQNKHFPIYFDLTAANLPYIIVSGGELSRSDKVNPQEVVNLIHSEFADLLEHD